jgi:steroid 5-alpha reductase family enzyme
MSYVDIGWPCGLVLISINAFIYGDGLPLRRYIACGLLFLHGFRMALGAILLFGKETNWTYRFKEDLPRYQFAKHRWINIDGMKEKHWWLKIQHDCGQQCFANISILALPTALCAFNKDPELHVVEMVGWLIWILAYTFENIADVQKQLFLADSKKLREEKGPMKGARVSQVLGYYPFDTSRYYLWTVSRHPNYFGELCCWFGFALAASASVPSATVETKVNHGVSNMILYMALMLMVRLFYDCLVWWTGAAPAEYFSCLKRKPSYQQYQCAVPCLFPFPFFGIEDHRVANWPISSEDGETTILEDQKDK